MAASLRTGKEVMGGDTIAAIATAPGRGGVAVVRVSGPDALPIGERLTGKPIDIGRVAFRTIGIDRGTVLDCGVVLGFKAPHSYTGEDVVEFQCHGGAVTPRRILEVCFAVGARLARRGEFTERAFLNGRLSYEQAESVLDLIDAKTARAADAALSGLAGRRAHELKALYESLLDLSSQLEHALDVDEGELSDEFFSSVNSQLTTLDSQLSTLLRRAHEGHLLRQGALVVLAGPPNAGKSSLMNALLETDRAIVSDTPGTTRDTIEEWLDLDGWPIRLVDTAGLRTTDESIEAMGVARAEALIAKADVVVWLAGGEKVKGRGERSTAVGSRDEVKGRGERSTAEIFVWSKCDLCRGEGLNVSAKTGEGLAALKREIVARLEAQVREGTRPEDGGAVREGDVSVLQAAKAQLASVVLPICDLVLAANAVRAAAAELGAAIGATYSQDLLDRLFSRFCVGK